MYLPFDHLGGDNLPEDYVKRITKDLIEYADVIYMANATYDMGWLLKWGIPIPSARVNDIQVAEALLDAEKLTYSLDSLSKEYLGRTKDERLLKEAASAYGCDPKGGLWKLPARYVGKYAEIDALNTIEVGILQQPKLIADGLMEVWDVECSIGKICTKMTDKGVPVDVKKAPERI
jgi:DNA polymerase I-like protein with 3'-5' exonuclease and polymerase domains